MTDPRRPINIFSLLRCSGVVIKACCEEVIENYIYLVKQYSREGECYSSVYDFYARRALHQLKTHLQAGSCCSRNL